MSAEILGQHCLQFRSIFILICISNVSQLLVYLESRPPAIGKNERLLLVDLVSSSFPDLDIRASRTFACFRSIGGARLLGFSDTTFPRSLFPSKSVRRAEELSNLTLAQPRGD